MKENEGQQTRIATLLAVAKWAINEANNVSVKIQRFDLSDRCDSAVEMVRVIEREAMRTYCNYPGCMNKAKWAGPAGGLCTTHAADIGNAAAKRERSMPFGNINDL